MATTTGPFRTEFKGTHRNFSFQGLLYEPLSFPVIVKLDDELYIIKDSPIDEFKHDGVLIRTFKIEYE